MTVNPRRPAFRLPWGGESDANPEAQADSAPSSEGSDRLSAGSAWPKPDTASDVMSAAPNATAQPEAAEPPAAESSEFLHSLVEAMRAVAESSRDTSLTELRTAVETRVADLQTTSAEQADELRRLADLDVVGVGEWEKNEQERIRQEAEARREARRAQLAKQLAEHESASQREIEATRRRLADHERELDAFFAQLSKIDDPAAFVAAAKRMPRPPELARPVTPIVRQKPGEAPAPDEPSKPHVAAQADGAEAADAGEQAPAETATAEGGEPQAGASTTQLAERLAELDAQLAGTTPAHTTPASAATANGEAATAIVVKGLGSFGAITSFKQALERIEGIRGVTLSLGPTGEFVYRASHASEFDLVGAIRTIEGPGASIDEADGSLLVTVSRGR